MAETVTPHFGWTKPDIGGDASTWGYVLNATIDAIDAVAFSNQTNQGNYLPLAGGTVTGSLTVNGGINAGGINAGSITAGSITAGNLSSSGGITATGGASFGGGITTHGFSNLNGYTASLAPSGNNAYFALHNSAGTAMGYLYWDIGNRIGLQNVTGGGYMLISPDGSITTNGAFHTQEVTAADVNCTMLVCNGTATLYGALSVNNSSMTVDGSITSLGYITGSGYPSRPGSSNLAVSEPSHQYNHYWTGAENHLYLGSSDWGQIQTNSDYRMKKDIEPLGSMWGTVKALNPISYTHKDWTPPASVESQKKIGGSLVRSDNVERWGFLAHELQETLVESAANGVKDDPVAVQSPNPFTVIAALTKALQEAMTRIEALEAAREG